MSSQRYFSMRDAYKDVYLREEEAKPEGGKPGVPHFVPIPPMGLRRPVVIHRPEVNIDVTQPYEGPGEVTKAYYTYPAGFDPTNREDVAKKDYDGSKTRSESIEFVCDYLIGEGFASDPEGAEAMFNHMSDKWYNMIVEKSCDSKKKEKK